VRKWKRKEENRPNSGPCIPDVKKRRCSDLFPFKKKNTLTSTGKYIIGISPENAIIKLKITLEMLNWAGFHGF
jgi:hypothetical protein